MESFERLEGFTVIGIEDIVMEEELLGEGIGEEAIPGECCGEGFKDFDLSDSEFGVVEILDVFNDLAILVNEDNFIDMFGV